ncbi:adenylate/guanylate cyclase domain-containing protein [Thauera chlorobenzoica]|uniref:adenylate/guanylate cyclase domain-containing protein n=1 Tax=Thauera chlorobenzoica TaxID=96773 RepID=UPI0008A012AB|nr:adenylate/guanylate cyclase domain-containing protein [Thauera chlorobenzoica]SEF76004.1 Adenylate cyclase, class 3 [Thauera chlorobenzoica]
MEQSTRTVVFADLTGSTGLFESAGNVVATQIVTRCTHVLGRHLAAAGGDVVKFLGDGVLVLFDDPIAAVQATARMQDVLQELATVELRCAPLGVKTGIDRGAVVEYDGDCYGDPVNVAARLCDRAQAGEVLIGEPVFGSLPEGLRLACHSLDRITLKGKAEPLRVWRVDFARTAETTLASLLDYRELLDGVRPLQRIDLGRLDQHIELHPGDGPLIIGRGEGAGFAVDDPRVSRRHARIEWAGEQCVLTDFSSNGSWVHFSGAAAPVQLRRERCTLHGEGEIFLGTAPDDFTAPTLGFRVIDER